MTRARNIAKLVSEQVSGNVNISGILTASTFFGEGSGITGVSPVGSGVTILDDGVSRGSASKIDFADHFSVSSISSGIATITVGITTEYIESRQINNIGVVTTGSIIVGSAVTVNAYGINGGSGIITAGRYEIVGFSTISDAGIDIVGVITAATAIFSDCAISDTLDALGPSNFTLPINANGGINASGVVTASSFIGDGTQLTGIGTADVRTNSLVISGVSTFVGFSTFQDYVFIQDGLTNAGVTTSNAYAVDGTQIISSARELQNIASLDTTTTATIEAAIANAPNTFTNLEVTGISTFGSSNKITISDSGYGKIAYVDNGARTSEIEFVTGNVFVYPGNLPGNHFNVIGSGFEVYPSSGITTSKYLFSQSLNVSGVSTFTTAYATELSVASATVEINNGGVDVVGIVTATGGFVSVANTSPVQIQVVGNQLIFNVVGIGSTTLTLA